MTNTCHIGDVVSRCKESSDRDRVNAFAGLVVPWYLSDKCFWSNGFLVIGDNHVCAVNPNKTDAPERDIFRVGDYLDHSFYDLATSMADGRDIIPIIPCTYDVEQKVIEAFEAAGLDECISHYGVPLSDFLPESVSSSQSTNVAILSYGPVDRVTDAFEFLIDMDPSITDLQKKEA